MTGVKTFLADLKAALEKTLGVPVEIQSTPGNINVTFKYQVPLPLCLRIECEILQSHQEDIDGELATVVDDFKIVSTQLIQEEMGPDWVEHILAINPGLERHFKDIIREHKTIQEDEA